MARAKTKAVLLLTSVVGRTATVNTTGTRAGWHATISTWTLVWGDGSEAIGTGTLPASLSHAYATGGTYQSSLTVFDTRGGSAKATLTISLPASTPAYALTVVNGIGGGFYQAGVLVTIAANAVPVGQVFSNWTGATVTDPTAATTTLIMPSAPVTVTANYIVAPVQNYVLTVNSGSGDGSYAPGTVVTIVADAASAGHVFSQWTGATVANPSAASTTITMPSANTTVTANYITIPTPTYALTVASGTGSGTYAAGTVVAIAANAPPSGKVFALWTAATVAPFGSADTSRTIFTKPTLPTLGSAGFTFQDPTFKSMILRVSDSSTVGGTSVRSVGGAGNTQAWNTTSTRFIATTTGGATLLYDFNAATMTATLHATLQIDNVTFSLVDPDLLYGHATGAGDEAIVVRYNCATAVTTIVVGVRTLIPSVDNAGRTYLRGTTTAVISGVEYLSFIFGGQSQDHDFYAYWGPITNISAGKTLNSLASTINGTSSQALGVYLHAGAIDLSGRYVILGPSNSVIGPFGPNTPAAFVWDTTTDGFELLTYGSPDSDGGHGAYGYGAVVNFPDDEDGMDSKYRTLASPHVFQRLISPFPTPSDFQMANHASWSNASPTVLNPILAAWYRYAIWNGSAWVPNAGAWRTWDEEVVAVSTDGSGIVYRFAHHRSDTNNRTANDIDWFWYTPRPNISNDGKWGLFTSNWEKTLGTDSGEPPNSRQDLFLISLAGFVVAPSGIVASPTSASTTVTMPSVATTVTATYVDAAPTLFALTVASGTGSGNYAANTLVSIAANAPPGGQVFSLWTGATVTTPTAASTTLVMPAAATTVTATYVTDNPPYVLTVTSGSGSGSYTAGTSVPIVASAAPSGKIFSQWIGAAVANSRASSTTLLMPAAATTVTATYVSVFTLTVVSGTGSGTFLAGATASITANPPPSGQVFSLWSGATVASTTSISTTLTMPAANTTVTATYVVTGPFTLTVVNGTGSGVYAAGTTVPITATATLNGLPFIDWTGAVVANAASLSTTIIMPAVNTTVTASYSKRVLSLSDLTWLGTFQSPSYIAANGGAVTYPYFTLRRIGGVLKTLWLTTDHGGFAPPNELIQVDYPGCNATLASAPLASANFRNFGNGWLTHAVGQDGRILNGLYASGITWDDRNNCVWVLYSDVYNTSGYKDPVLIRGDINDAASDATAVTWSGPWRLAGTVAGSTSEANSHQTQSFLTAVPSTYGAAHLGGASIALGGSYSSGGIASPFNNVLWAPSATPTSSTPTQPNGGSDLAAVCLIGGDITAGHRGRRPGDYTTEFCNPPAGQGDTDPTSYTRGSLTGYWGAFDGVGSCVWLDWDTVKGVLFLAVHGRGHIWYNNAGLHPPPPGVCAHGLVDRYFVTGPEAVVRQGNDSYGNPEPPGDFTVPYGTGPDQEAALYAYNPDQFVQASGGSPWQVPVHDWSYCLDKFPNFAVDSAVGAKIVIKTNGMAADQSSRLLMIPMGYVTGGTTSGFGFYVNVFSVAL